MIKKNANSTLVHSVESTGKAGGCKWRFNMRLRGFPGGDLVSESLGTDRLVRALLWKINGLVPSLDDYIETGCVFGSAEPTTLEGRMSTFEEPWEIFNPSDAKDTGQSITGPVSRWNIWTNYFAKTGVCRRINSSKVPEILGVQTGTYSWYTAPTHNVATEGPLIQTGGFESRYIATNPDSALSTVKARAATFATDAERGAVLIYCSPARLISIRHHTETVLMSKAKVVAFDPIDSLNGGNGLVTLRPVQHQADAIPAQGQKAGSLAVYNCIVVSGEPRSKQLNQRDYVLIAHVGWRRPFDAVHDPVDGYIPDMNPVGFQRRSSLLDEHLRGTSIQGDTDCIKSDTLVYVVNPGWRHGVAHTAPRVLTGQSRC